MVDKVNLARAFDRFGEVWSPRLVGAVNDYDVKVARARGEFVWHEHADTDEFFLVLEGVLRIRLAEHPDVVLEPGEMFVVPRGLRHCPVADEPARILLLEPRETVNTGDAPGVAGTTGVALGSPEQA